MAEAKKTKKTTKDVANDQLAETQAETQSGEQAINQTIEKENENGITETSTDQSSTEEKEVKTAKAGKRSAKSQKEVEEKQEKEARKASADDSDTEKPKQKQNPPKSKLERKSKNYRKLNEQIDKDKSYDLPAALDLAVKTNPAKFDATVEMHIRLGLDPRQADQNLRDTIVLPAGTGKTVRIAVLADDDGVAAAKKAGADIAAGDELLQSLDKGVIDFDILIAMPSMMPKLGKYARVLGPKGLMPNPKSGTVTTDVAKAVTESKAGKVEYRVDSTGIVHVGIGKVSFGGEKLTQNAKALLASIKSNKPSSLKGTYVRSVFVTSSMGPSIQVLNSEAN
jgi:ribosomal protein L1